MAIQIADNFTYQGKKPLDARIVSNTLADLVALSADILYDGCLAYVKGNKTYYTYDSTNETDQTLGKWKELETGATGDFIPTSAKGANGGVAELDSSGKVPSSQLPSYVDDVKSYPTKNDFPAEGEDDKIYIAKDENSSYRWDGSDYVSISSANGLTLGETSSTAYRGDRGKIAYDDSQTNKTAIGTLANLTTTEKTNLVGAINEIDNALDGKVDAVQGKGLSENDYSDADKTIVDGVTDALADKVDKVSGKGLSTNDYDNTEKQKVADAQPKTLATPITVEGVQQTTVEGALGAINNKSGGGGTSDYDDLTNKPQINSITLSGNKTLADLGIQASESGKGLSTNDYTTAEKTKLASLSNYDDTALSGRVSDIEAVVPANASSSNKLATISDIGSSGHTIQDAEGTSMSARGNLQFVGANVTDDSTNNKTVVTVTKDNIVPITNAEIDAMWNGTYQS